MLQVYIVQLSRAKYCNNVYMIQEFVRNSYDNCDWRCDNCGWHDDNCGFLRHCGWCCDNCVWLRQLWTLRQLWSHQTTLGPLDKYQKAAKWFQELSALSSWKCNSDICCGEVYYIVYDASRLIPIPIILLSILRRHWKRNILNLCILNLWCGGSKLSVYQLKEMIQKVGIPTSLWF
mgnify:CR=1 FL=1